MHTRPGAASNRNAYLAKHQLRPLELAEHEPSEALGLIVVVPARGEGDLVPTLASLWACERSRVDVEVLVVFNAAADDPPTVHERNRAALQRARHWARGRSNPSLAFHFLWYPDMTPRWAGVGLARKTGMDEAVARLHAVGKSNGAIACLDADCTCDPDYLQALERYFRDDPGAKGCSVYFEHPLTGPEPAVIYEGIARYELFLRYYVHALRYAGFPFAHYTLGSCMAVRSAVYEAEGGMNRRRAGEDFYFLSKIARLGGFGEVSNTIVRPSPRASRRIPFGTGRAMTEWLAGRDRTRLVYAPKVFDDLRELLLRVPDLYTAGPTAERALRALPPSVSDYLHHASFSAKLAEIRANVASERAFMHRFYAWLDPFRAFKLVKWASRSHHPPIPLADAASALFARHGLELPAAADPVRAALERLRAVDRAGRGLRGAKRPLARW